MKREPASQMARRRSDRPVMTYVLGSLVLVTLLYAQAITTGFSSYDDQSQVVMNPNISSLSASLRYFQSPVIFTSDLRGSGESTYSPLFWLSLALDDRLWGLNPEGFHLTNVLLHWLCALLLFLLLRRINFSQIASGLTSLIWICLPINCEAVTWISGRPHCLAAFFILFGMYIADLYLIRAEVRYLVGYWFAVSAALLSHEEGVLVFAFTLLLTIARCRIKSRQAAILSATAVVSILSYLGLRHVVGATGVAARGTLAAFGLFLWKYLNWMVLPVHMSMERSTDVPQLLWSRSSFAAWIIFAAVCAALIALRRRLSKASFGFAWITIGLLPFCGIVEIYQGMAERYSYVASMGVALTMVAIGIELPARLRPSARGLVAIWVLWGVFRLETRIADWSDAARLYQSSLQATPLSSKLHYNLGAVLETRGDFGQAGDEYKQAIALRPSYEPAIAGLGNAYLNLGRTKAAVSEFQEALQRKPDDVKTEINLGTALQSLGDLNGAEAEYRRAIALAPRNDDAYCDLGVLLLNIGDTNNAVLQFLNAAKINPNDPIPLFNLAAIYQKSGRPDLAMKLYARVLQLNPGDADASSALKALMGLN